MDIKGEFGSNAVILGDLTPIDFSGQIFQAEGQQGDGGLK